MLDQATVEDQGWALGDTVGVLAKDATTPMTIVGTASFGDVEGIPGFTVIATDDATAQAMFAQPGAYDAIVVAAAEGTTPHDAGRPHRGRARLRPTSRSSPVTPTPPTSRPSSRRT